MFIIRQKNRYFLNPHFDDLLISVGGLLLKKEFRNKNNKAIVFFGLTNYRSDKKSADNQADSYVNQVTATRIQEDRNALSKLFNGWRNYHYTVYGEEDAALRNFKNKEGGLKGDFSNFRKKEKKIFQNICNITKLILQNKNTAVLVPLALEPHIDHFILREAVIKAANDLADAALAQIYFTEDRAYQREDSADEKLRAAHLIKRLHLKPISYRINVDKKIKIFTNCYPSQYEKIYVDSMRLRARELKGKEIIYKWPKKYYACTEPHKNTNKAQE